MLNDSSFLFFCSLCAVLQANGDLQGDPSLHEHNSDWSLHVGMHHEDLRFRIQGKTVVAIIGEDWWQQQQQVVQQPHAISNQVV